MAGAMMGAGSRRRGRRRRALVSEINVTPFVDVMLVLLIVFMVTAPLLTTGIAVDLPKTEAKALPTETDPLTITVQQNGAIFIQDSEIDQAALLERLAAVSGQGYDQRIFVRADTNAAYGRVAEVMATMSAAGYKNLGLVTDPLQKPVPPVSPTPDAP
jgi:biopolymer transport protein TolR